MTVVLSWGSEKEIQVGNIKFSNQKKVRKLNGVMSYGYGTAGVAGETDAYVLKRDDIVFHDIAVEWSGPDAFMEVPLGRLFLLSLPNELRETVESLGVSRATGDALWVISFLNNSAQIGSNYIAGSRYVPFGEEGALKVN